MFAVLSPVNLPDSVALLLRIRIDLVTPSTQQWVPPPSTPRPYRAGIVPGFMDMDAFVNDLKQSAAAAPACSAHVWHAALAAAASLVLAWAATQGQ